MISPRTIGVFMIGCGAILLTIAFERYYSVVQTAKAIAEQIEGVEFESVAMPTVSAVCGFAGVVLLAAGLRMLFESRHANKPDDGLLSSER